MRSNISQSLSPSDCWVHEKLSPLLLRHRHQPINYSCALKRGQRKREGSGEDKMVDLCNLLLSDVSYITFAYVQ